MGVFGARFVGVTGGRLEFPLGRCGVDWVLPREAVGDEAVAGWLPLAVAGLENLEELLSRVSISEEPSA